jgi:membrane protease YdiL (CAAX protease family)
MASVAALVAGTVGFSHLVDWGVRSLGMREDSLLVTIDTALLETGGWALLLCIAGVAIAPGIGEELLFRGLLMRSLIRRVGIAAGIVSSAVLFGALHVDWAQGCAAAVLGVYLGAVAFASGSTRTPILCHMANNLTAVLAASQGMGHAGWAQEPTLLALSVGGALVGLTALARTLPAAAGAWKHS